MLFGCRVKKDFPRVEAIGAVDELNAVLGMLRVAAVFPMTQNEVPLFQQTLITLMGVLATPVGSEDKHAKAFGEGIAEATVSHLDDLVAELEAMGALEIKGWALPGAGGVMSGAYADFARTVCRRAERSVVTLDDTDEEVPNKQIVRYLNRLSDVLWLLARMEEKQGAQV